jgi:hypothetical protein
MEVEDEISFLFEPEASEAVRWWSDDIAISLIPLPGLGLLEVGGTVVSGVKVKFLRGPALGVIHSIEGDLEGDLRSMISPWPFPFPTLPEAIVCQTLRLLLPRFFFPAEGVARFEAASASSLLLFCRFSHSSLADSILFTSLVFFSTGTVAGFGVFLSVSRGIIHGSLRFTFPLRAQVLKVLSPFINYLVSHFDVEVDKTYGASSYD